MQCQHSIHTNLESRGAVVAVDTAGLSGRAAHAESVGFSLTAICTGGPTPRMRRRHYLAQIAKGNQFDIAGHGAGDYDEGLGPDGSSSMQKGQNGTVNVVLFCLMQ